jgi:hypothetical protein
MKGHLQSDRCYRLSKRGDQEKLNRWRVWASNADKRMIVQITTRTNQRHEYGVCATPSLVVQASTRLMTI